MPMNAIVKPHVETNQDDRVRAELNNGIVGLKTRIAAISDHAGHFRKQLVRIAFEFIFAKREQMRTIDLARLTILRKPKTFEIRLTKFPPCTVSGIQCISPRA